MTKRCPTPHKVGHTSRAAAWGAYWADKRKQRVGIYVYKCKCGKWHVGRRVRKKK